MLQFRKVRNLTSDWTSFIHLWFNRVIWGELLTRWQINFHACEWMVAEFEGYLQIVQISLLWKNLVLFLCAFSLGLLSSSRLSRTKRMYWEENESESDDLSNTNSSNIMATRSMSSCSKSTIMKFQNVPWSRRKGGIFWLPNLDLAGNWAGLCWL